MKLSIIVPIYNDRDYIKQAIAQIQAVALPVPYEIVAVDDFSTDGSREILQSIPHITKVFHHRNTGKGGAIQTGLKHATGDIIAIQDDDCEYDPASLPALIAPILAGQAQVVYGSRFLQANRLFFIQRLQNIALTHLTNWLLGQKLTDVETGHKVFTRAVANTIQLTKKGFEFDMEITLQIIQSGLAIKELPTTYRARTHKQGKKITYRDGLRTIATLLRYCWRPFTDNFRSLLQRRLLHAGLIILLLIAIFLPRLASLGTLLTVDEPLWQSRGQTFITNLSIADTAKTLIAGQPGVITNWLVGITGSTSLAVNQASVAVTTGILILICTYFLTDLLGSRWGLLAGFWLALDPFLLGHSRVVHTDALGALFYFAGLAAVLSGLKPLRAKQTPIMRYLLFGGVMMGAAALCKFFNLIGAATAIGIISLTVWRYRPSWQLILRLCASYSIVGLLTIYILWPVLWLHAGNAFTLLFQRGAIHSAGTHSADVTSTSWYYLREGFFRLTVPATLLIGFGLWYIIRRRTTAAWAAGWLFISGLLFVTILSVPSDKSDRYALFTFISFIPACILGLRFVALKLTKSWPTLKPAYIAIFLLPIIYLAADDIRLHPYYLAHYNRLYPIEANHKLGWGEGLETAAAWIAQQNPQAKVLSYYPRVFQYFYHGPADTITHIDSANWDYIVLYRAMFERAPDDPETDIVNNYLTNHQHQPAHIVTVNGLPYAWIFAASPQPAP